MTAINELERDSILVKGDNRRDLVEVNETAAGANKVGSVHG